VNWFHFPVNKTPLDEVDEENAAYENNDAKCYGNTSIFSDVDAFLRVNACIITAHITT
jgi:hypothetical protein